MADMEEKILRYRKYLDKYQNRDSHQEELLSILRKLDRLPVTLEHLQSTGIGKTVNSYRKQHGDVAERAKVLVAKWKNLVPIPTAGPQSSSMIKCETVSETSYKSGTELIKKEPGPLPDSQRVPYMQPSKIQIYRDSVDSRGEEDPETPRSPTEGEGHCDDNEDRYEEIDAYNKHVDVVSNEECDNIKNDKYSNRPDSDKSTKKSERTSQGHSKDKHKSNHKEKYRDKHDKDRSADKNHSSGKESREKEKSHSSTDSSKDRHGKSSSSKDRHDRTKSKSSHSGTSDKHRSSSRDRPGSQEDLRKRSVDKELGKANMPNDKRHDNHSHKNRDSRNEKHKEKTASKAASNSSMNKYKEDEYSASQKAAAAVKEEQDDVSEMNEELLRDLKDLGDIDDADVMMDQEVKPPTFHFEDEVVEDEKAKQVQKFVDVIKSKKRKSESAPLAGLPKKPKAEETTTVQNEGFSFDDLMKFDAIKIKKHMKKKQKQLGDAADSPPQSKPDAKSSSKHKHEKHESSSKHSSSKAHEHKHSSKPSGSKHKEGKDHSSSSRSRSGQGDSKREKSHSSKTHSSSSKHRSSSNPSSQDSQSNRKSSSSSSSSSSKRKSQEALAVTDVPTPPKQVKLSAVDILGTLPELSPNYHPLPYPKSDSSLRKDEVSEDCTIKRNTRTQVYSGRKNAYVSALPTLYDACMRVLLDNIDNLESVGGVPYDILKPVLEKCSASQLYTLEEYNPQFIGETESLWQRLCGKEFKMAEPSEFESWRELYLRQHDEREAKLKKLTSNISQSMVKKNEPVRTTKLAYVDIAAKPPRGVRRQQMRHGTAGPMGAQDPLSKLTSHGRSETQAKAPIPRRFDLVTSSPPGGSRQKQTKTPMMQKTLRMMKKMR